MSEKKWFIYVQDHHEGPFTVDEIQSGISEGRFEKTGFVWADGMKDWLPMGQLPDFAPPAAAPVQPMIEEIAVASPVTEEPSFSATVTPVEAETDTSPAEPVVERPVRGSDRIAGTNTTIVEVGELRGETDSQPHIIRPAVLGAGAATRPSTQAPGEKTPFFTPRMKPIFLAFAILGVLFGVQKAGLLKRFEDRVSAIFSTLPPLPDVAPEDYEALKKVAKSSPSDGPQVSLALSKADALSPIFYVATNLPDGARFEIYIEGVSHRILNTLAYSGKLDVTTQKRLAKSQPLRYADGKPIPRGEYVVYVMEAPVGQPDLVYKELVQLAPIARNLPYHLPQERRLVYSKQIFFGSKDATYEQRLKEFHDTLVAKAKSETMELGQALSTLESQAEVSMAAYDRLKRQPIGPKQKQAWNDINRTWRPIQAQIVQRYAGQSIEKVKEEYFHANLVSEFIVIEKIVSDLHSAQEKLFTTSANVSLLEAEVTDLRTQFETRKTAFKSAIETALANPSDATTGLPVKVSIETKSTAAAAKSGE